KLGLCGGVEPNPARSTPVRGHVLAAVVSQRFPLSRWFGCRSGGYRVAGYRQQRHPNVGFSRLNVGFSCRFL
ncbi:unnamed protein product, partial [Brassica oleracea]